VWSLLPRKSIIAKSLVKLQNISDLGDENRNLEEDISDLQDDSIDLEDGNNGLKGGNSYLEDNSDC